MIQIVYGGGEKRTVLLSSPVYLSQATELLNKLSSEKPWSHVCTAHKQLSYTDNQMACVRNILCTFACCLLGYLQTVKIEIQPICGWSKHHENLIGYRARNPFHDLTFTVVAIDLSVMSASDAGSCAAIWESKNAFKSIGGYKGQRHKLSRSLRVLLDRFFFFFFFKCSVNWQLKH